MIKEASQFGVECLIILVLVMNNQRRSRPQTLAELSNGNSLIQLING